MKPEHVKIKRIEDGWQMDVNYEVRKPLIANLDVVGKFSTTENLTDRGRTMVRPTDAGPSSTAMPSPIRACWRRR